MLPTWVSPNPPGQLTWSHYVTCGQSHTETILQPISNPYGPNVGWVKAGTEMGLLHVAQLGPTYTLKKAGLFKPKLGLNKSYI